jgi:altronate dehydratase
MYYRFSRIWSNCCAFTTGLGTPMGNPISPVVKISSNSVLAERMSDIIDFNAGTVITGEKQFRKQQTSFWNSLSK